MTATFCPVLDADARDSECAAKKRPNGSNDPPLLLGRTALRVEEAEGQQAEQEAADMRFPGNPPS